MLCVRHLHEHINIIKNKFSVTFVSLRIIVYPAILCINLPYQFKRGDPPAGALQDHRYMSFELSFEM
jgi:hypothetical protein